jgi:hypothetical protein
MFVAKSFIKNVINIEDRKKVMVSKTSTGEQKPANQFQNPNPFNSNSMVGPQQQTVIIF